jgi:hypothetical protein
VHVRTLTRPITVDVTLVPGNKGTYDVLLGGILLGCIQLDLEYGWDWDTMNDVFSDLHDEEVDRLIDAIHALISTPEQRKASYGR